MTMRKNEAAWIESRQRWQIKVQADGERRTFTCSTAGKKGKISAERKADEWLEHRLVSTSTRCDVLLDSFAAHKQDSTSAGNSRLIDYHIKYYIRPVIGSKRISSVTENDLQRVLDRAFAAGLSKKTLTNIRSTVTAFVKYCRKEKVTSLFPEDLSIPRSAPKAEKNIAQPRDIQLLFSKVDTMHYGKRCVDRYIHAYRLAVLTGLRPGELLGLRWEDLKGNVLRVRRSYNNLHEITDGKNENAHRDLAISGLAAQELAAQRLQLASERLLSVYIFPAPDAGPTSQKNFRRYWARFCEVHDMTHTTPYELRHTFVSMNSDMPDGLKRRAMGHSQTMDTEGVYGHLLDGDLERIADFSNATIEKILEKEQVGT